MPLSKERLNTAKILHAFLKGRELTNLQIVLKELVGNILDTALESLEKLELPYPGLFVDEAPKTNGAAILVLNITILDRLLTNPDPSQFKIILDKNAIYSDSLKLQLFKLHDLVHNIYEYNRVELFTRMVLSADSIEDPTTCQPVCEEISEFLSLVIMEYKKFLENEFHHNYLEDGYNLEILKTQLIRIEMSLPADIKWQEELDADKRQIEADDYRYAREISMSDTGTGWRATWADSDSSGADDDDDESFTFEQRAAIEAEAYAYWQRYRSLEVERDDTGQVVINMEDSGTTAPAIDMERNPGILTPASGVSRDPQLLEFIEDEESGQSDSDSLLGIPAASALTEI